MGCLQCILGAIIIVLHAPEQSQADTTIETFKKAALSVGKFTMFINIHFFLMTHFYRLLGLCRLGCLYFIISSFLLRASMG